MKLAALALLAACADPAAPPLPLTWEGPTATTGRGPVQWVVAAPATRTRERVTVWLLPDGRIISFRGEREVAERFPDAEALLRRAASHRLQTLP